MIGQRALAALALVAGVLAGGLYYAGTQRAPVVVAARDLDALHPLGPEDLTTIALPPDAVPQGALANVGSAIGKVPRGPLWRGQVVLAAGVADDAASFPAGLLLPLGMRAVALPVSAPQAVGGALVPGARVDVLAVPLIGRAPAGRTTELLAQGALVLDVRTETGTPYAVPTASKTSLGTVTERIGSVVIAIDPLDEVRFADRIATSTFVLTFAGSR